MEYKAIFLDFDDTLGDRNQYAYQLWRRAVTENTDETDPFEIEAMVQDCMIWDQNGDAPKAYAVEQLEKRYGVKVKYEDFNAWWEANLCNYAVAFSDSRSTLLALKQKGYQLGLITNGPSEGQRKKAEHAGLADLLDDIVVSADYGIKKPDVRLFQIAAERLGVSRKSVSWSVISSHGIFLGHTVQV